MTENVNSLSPDLQQAVPASSTKGGTIAIYTEARNPVVMTIQRVDTLSLDGVPTLARVVIITTEEVTTRDRKGNGCDSTVNGFLSVYLQFTASTDIKQARGGVIGTSSKGLSIREEANSVDIAFVSREGLCGLSSSNIPQLGSTVTGTRNKRLSIRGKRNA